jgi:hypothetical protein
MKRCFKCGETKPLDCFGNDKNRADGKEYKCKSCKKEYAKTPQGKINQQRTDLKYYNKNRIDKINKVTKWRQDNADRVKIVDAQWRDRVYNELGAGVYKIINHILDKYYIGESNAITRRLKTHFSKTKSDNHIAELFNDMEKYGRENFTWEILLNVDISGLSYYKAKKLLRQHETEFISQYPKDKLYNSYKIKYLSVT